MTRKTHDNCYYINERFNPCFKCVNLSEWKDIQKTSDTKRRRIKLNPVSGFRHVHGKKFIEAFDRAYKLK